MTDEPPIERILQRLAHDYETPDDAVRACARRMDEAAPPLLALLNRAAGQGLSREPDRVLLFRAVHIMGAARVPAACRPLLRFLRRREDEVHAVLGDAVTESLPRIIPGVFDGDAPALFTAIGDRAISEHARWSLLLAAAFLVADGRISRDAAEAFLRRFHAEKLAPPLDAAWIGWGEVVARLGMTGLMPAVEEAWAAFPADVVDLPRVREALADALAAPHDLSRFESDSGYLDDPVAAFDWVRKPGGPWEEDVPEPVVNPLRHVGRNDPCPCGSGKKYKKCCLAA